MPDDTLWAYLEESDQKAIVGLKKPGSARGVWKGKNLLNQAEQQIGIQAVANQPGVELISTDEMLPIVGIEFEDKESFVNLRSMPFVDYLEPAFVTRGYYRADTDFGCSLNLWSGGEGFSLTGDAMPDHYIRMKMRQAWDRSTGDGITLGLVDTGIYQSSSQMTVNFNAGQSANRTILYEEVGPFAGLVSYGSCSHGTRMAGLMTAPRDGEGPVGVAWGANLVSVTHNDDVVASDAAFGASEARYAIREAASNGSNIIAMAWGTESWFNSIEAEIQNWYHYQNRLFIGAAGTTSSCADFTHTAFWETYRGVLFPAELLEVMAVTAVDTDEKVACNVHSGGEVELVAYYGYPTAGRLDEVLSMSGSSSATAVIAGVAALVWSRYPNADNDEVRSRLHRSGSFYPERTDHRGYGVVNAYAAVGGFTSLSLHAPITSKPYQSFNVSATPSGDGPFTYYWNNGATTASTTYTAGADGTYVPVMVSVTDVTENRIRTASKNVPAESHIQPPDTGCEPYIVCP